MLRLAKSLVILILLFPLFAIAIDDFDPVRGYWGGPSVSFYATDGGADGNFHCSFGRISEPITPDRYGKFSSPGYIDFYEGGAKPPTRVQAIFSGSVDEEEEQMELTVSLATGIEWKFSLTEGSIGETKKCFE